MLRGKMLALLLWLVSCSRPHLDARERSLHRELSSLERVVACDTRYNAASIEQNMCLYLVIIFLRHHISLFDATSDDALLLLLQKKKRTRFVLHMLMPSRVGPECDRIALLPTQQQSGTGGKSCTCSICLRKYTDAGAVGARENTIIQLLQPIVLLLLARFL